MDTHKGLKSMVDILHSVGFDCLVDERRGSAIGWANDMGVIHAWRNGSKPLVGTAQEFFKPLEDE